MEYTGVQFCAFVEGGDQIMAGYPQSSPFFRTFAPRKGNVGQMWQSAMEAQKAAEPARPSYPTVPWFGAGNSRGMLGQPLQENPSPWQAQQLAQIPQPPPEPELQPPPTPETAAARIQQVNRTLPDGVRYEPIDEETWAALRKMQKSQMEEQKQKDAQKKEETKVSPTSTAPSNAAPVEAASQVHAPPTESIPGQALLESLIQDERNASIFYEHLSKSASSNEIISTLQEISKASNSRHSFYQRMLEEVYDGSYEVRDIIIKANIPFRQGIQIALREEAKIMLSMTKLIDQSDNKELLDPLSEHLNNLLELLNCLND